MIPLVPWAVLSGCLLLSPEDLAARLDTGSASRDSGRPDRDSGRDSADSGDTGRDTGDTATDSGETGETGDTRDSGPALCQALLFPTSDASVTVERIDTGESTNTGGWTLEVWIYYQSGTGAVFQKWLDGNEDRQIGIGEKAGDIVTYAAAYTNTGTTQVEGNVLAADRWTHLAWVSNNASLTLFQDGEIASTAAAGTVFGSTADLVFGHLLRGMDEIPAFVGGIGDARVSSGARYTLPFTPEAHLSADDTTLHLWPMNEGTGTVVDDHGSGSKNGVLTGTTWAELPCR